MGMVNRSPTSIRGWTLPATIDRLLWLKLATFALGLLPLALLAGRALGEGLGANPIEAITRFLGESALVLLLAALAVTPVRRVTGWVGVMRLRRMVGLFAFFYALLHVTSYVVLDQGLLWSAIWEDVVKRRFITAGMLSFLILVALAATSPRAVVRWLGGVRWKRLHFLVHGAAFLAVLHFFWMVKADTTRPLTYGAVLALLWGIRLVALVRRRR